MTDVDTLDRLVKAIFVDSFKTVSVGTMNYSITPFNVEEIKQRIKVETSTPDDFTLDRLSYIASTISRDEYKEFYDIIRTIIFNPSLNYFKNKENLRLFQEKLDNLRKRNIDIDKVDLSLPYDAETVAFDLIPQFNKQFDPYVRINIFDAITNGKPVLVVEFNEANTDVVRQLFDLQPAHGVPLYRYPEEKANTLIKEGDSYSSLAFMEREGIDSDYPQNKRLDNTPDTTLSYLICGEYTPDFLPQLLKSYIQHKMSLTR